MFNSLQALGLPILKEQQKDAAKSLRFSIGSIQQNMGDFPTRNVHIDLNEYVALVFVSLLPATFPHFLCFYLTLRLLVLFYFGSLLREALKSINVN